MPRSHSPDFCTRAIQIARETKPLDQIAKDPEINSNCLRNWVKREWWWLGTEMQKPASCWWRGDAGFRQVGGDRLAALPTPRIGGGHHFRTPGW